MKCSLGIDYVVYMIISKLICSHSVNKDEIPYHAIECSVIYEINEISNWLVVD